MKYMAYGAISKAATMVQQTIENAAVELKRPSMLFKPKLYIEGNQWCAMYGDSPAISLQGWGNSPELALIDFDLNYSEELDNQPLGGWVSVNDVFPERRGDFYSVNVEVAVVADNGTKWVDIDKYDVGLSRWVKIRDKEGLKVIAWKSLSTFPAHLVKDVVSKKKHITDISIDTQCRICDFWFNDDSSPGGQACFKKCVEVLHPEMGGSEACPHFAGDGIPF